MMHTIFKRAGFFTMLVSMVFVLTPLVAYSGGPEPGPDDGGNYSYEPPPFSGDVQLILVDVDTPGFLELRMTNGTLNQLGNSTCSIEVDPTIEDTHITFYPPVEIAALPTCKDLHPNDLMGFTAEVSTTGCEQVVSIDIEIIATAKLLCQPGGDAPPTGATAKLIVMQYVPK